MQYYKNICLDLISEREVSFEPMHPIFEITLLVNSFAEHTCSDQVLTRGLGSAADRFRIFLGRYFLQYNRLPIGHYKILCESEEPVGSIDFSAIRTNIRILQKAKNTLNINRLNSSTEGIMLQMEWEMLIGIRDQKIGKNQNESVFRIREQNVRNQQSFLNG